MNDPRFVFDLENGRELRRKSVARVEAFMIAVPMDAQGVEK